jgi:HK97 family phage major capsid protein
MATYKGEEIDTRPTETMAEEAQRGLDWRAEFGRGGTSVGVARANQLRRREELSIDTVKRMASYFARHEVDKRAEGFRPGEDGYPSAGRIAWALWGGDAGQFWANARSARLKSIDERATPDALSVGDFVRWDSSGGLARGRIERIVRDGEINVPNSSFVITGSPDDPAALIRIFRETEEGWEATDTRVGHKFSTLTKIDALRGYTEKRPYPNEHAARLQDPDQYDSFARENDAGGPGIDFIYGIKGDESELQAIRFDKGQYSASEAREWLAEHDFSPIEFEEAIGEREASMETMDERHVTGIVETDDEVIVSFAKAHDESMDQPTDVVEDIVEEIEDELEIAGLRKGDKLVKRAADMEAVVGENRRVSMSVSSEMPVERLGGMEILDHSEGSINLSFLNSGRAPLLLDHDPTQQIGVVENVTLDGAARKLRASVRFGKSARASEVYEDIVDNIRGNVSIGYYVKKVAKTENGYRAMSWEPLEISIVSIPADPSVGVGRAAEAPQPVVIETISEKEPIMSQENTGAATAEAAVAKRNAELKQISELAARHNKTNLVGEAIERGMSYGEFQGFLLERNLDKPLHAPDVDMSPREQKQYSLLRAINSVALNGRISGFEAEVSAEIAKKQGKEARGFYVPNSLFAKRDILTTSPANGSNLVATDHLASEFIDALRANLVMGRLGARMLTGLKGDVAIPKMGSTATVAFVAENNAPSESAQTFTQVTMTPRTLASFTDISRKLAIQSDPSVEQIIREDMLQSFARKIDEVAIEGSTGGNEPAGILATNGIGSVAIGTNGGAITYAKLIQLEREVAIDNALMGNLGFLTNPKVIAAMRQVPRQSSGVEGNFILNDTNMLMGYDVNSTTLVPSDLTKGTSSGVCSAVIFGNFADVLIGMWGSVDILVDPFSGSSAGTIRLSAFQEVDVKLRHAESFAAIKDVTTA